MEYYSALKGNELSSRKDMEETQLKQPLDTATHLTEWPKSGILMTPNVDENVEQ